MNHSERIALVSEMNLSDAEKKKRAGLANRKPYVAEKLSKITENENNGIISPIIRIEKVIYVISNVHTAQQNTIWIDI